MPGMELIVLALATWEAIEIWHHGSLLATARLWSQNLDGRPRELLGCPFCLAPWVSMVLWLCLLTPWLSWLPEVLAVARLANLGNDLFHAWCRTPRFTAADLPEDPVSAYGIEEPHGTDSPPPV